jgi:hypothetical protein
VDRERSQFTLQPKAKPARFVHRVRRFWITPALLHHHHVNVLLHIHAKLDVGFVPLNRQTDSSIEYNSIFIIAGVGPKPAPDNPHHVIYALRQTAA